MGQACARCGAENDDDATACFTCGQQTQQAVRLGEIIDGRWEVRSRLGRGGMGAVYRVYDRKLDEEVALKVLREDVAGQQDAAKRFKDEIKIARRVIHRNVCRIFEYGEERGRLFFSMELVEGTDLKQAIVQAGRLPPERAFAIAIQLADGLEAIHQVGVIHRDLKTSNAMLDAAGTVRLMDFGIAKNVASEGTGATATGHILGTPAYMSPEQARGEKLDFRSDVYALGIVLYELFTGRVPFEADTPVAVIMKHINEAPPLEGPRATGLPASVLPILGKALAKSRETRYQSAAEMAQALRAAAADSLGRPLDTLPSGPSYGGPSGPTAPWDPAAQRAARAPTAVQQPTRVVAKDYPPTLGAATVVSEATRDGVTGTLVSTSTTAPQRRRSRAVIVAAAGLGLVVAGGIVAAVVFRHAGSTVASPSPVTSPVAVAARSLVAINAVPWARLTLRPRDASAGPVSTGDLVTPCVVELPDGAYTVELENGGVTPPLSRDIEVVRGARNEFVFTMPSFDPASAAKLAAEQP